jgi:phage anti-repressor protein
MPKGVGLFECTNFLFEYSTYFEIPKSIEFCQNYDYFLCDQIDKLYDYKCYMPNSNKTNIKKYF